MSDKRRLLAALLRMEFDAGNIDFRQTLSELAENVLEIDRAGADAYAEANLKKYWSWLAEERDAHVRRGLTPFLKVVSPSGYAVTPVCHAMLQSEDPLEKRRGLFAAARPAVLRQIDSLSAREYEALACVTCAAIGGSKTSLTPRGDEGNIDFFATLSIESGTHVLSGIGAEMRIVGQCKKYESPVAVDKVEQFVATMQNVRHRSERVRRHIPEWFNQSRGPIVGWIMAHSGFQSGAADEAKNHGILLSDTLDIAELVAHSKAFHPDVPPSARGEKVSTACQSYLT